MISVGSISSHLMDKVITTTASTAAYNVSFASAVEGVYLVSATFSTASTNHASYVYVVHRQNNIGITQTQLSKREYNATTMTLSGDQNTLTFTLGTAQVGTLKVSIIQIS